MSMFDTVSVGKREGQVKLWERMCRSFTNGSKVSAVDGCKTYAIAMREGGYVNVKDCVIESWTDKPKHKTVFDKYGGMFDESALPVGLIGEHYLFSEAEKEFDDEEKYRKTTASHHIQSSKRAERESGGAKAKRTR